jgi:hypothetical protein
MIIVPPGQEDTFYAAASLACTIFLFIYIVTAKSIHEEIRNPFVAMLIATVAGILLYASKALPLMLMAGGAVILVAGILLNLLSRNTKSPLLANDPNAPSSESVVPPQSRKKTGLIIAIAAVVIGLGVAFVAYRHHATAPTAAIAAPQAHTDNGLLPQDKPSAPDVQNTPVAAPVSAVVVSADSTVVVDQKSAAVANFQQAKIEQAASIHTLDVAWTHLSKVTAKSGLNAWKKAQTQWANTKHDTCGKIEANKDIAASSASEMEIEISALKCDRDANLNRATYLTNNANSITEEKGQVDDDIGSLISKVKLK